MIRKKEYSESIQKDFFWGGGLTVDVTANNSGISLGAAGHPGAKQLTQAEIARAWHNIESSDKSCGTQCVA